VHIHTTLLIHPSCAQAWPGLDIKAQQVCDLPHLNDSLGHSLMRRLMRTERQREKEKERERKGDRTIPTMQGAGFESSCY